MIAMTRQPDPSAETPDAPLATQTASTELRLILSADPAEVRKTLEVIRGARTAVHQPQGRIDEVETVLAEVLNNIVEHACAGQHGAQISITAWIDRATAEFEIIDCGAPMPGLHLPEGRPPRRLGHLAETPEGGFGWFIVRSLASDARYSRVDGKNNLRLRIV